ncbi:ATP-binding protein [Streptomyces sp. WMMB 322]|uniref:ATP-binding protein n=1 Tax=Streptomyces sp. WMMB 322 TaxID=1286821 RepID=UPI0006E3039A|nr:ATP-binding protein [Streptomyces sp. WMMB 322]SCK35953.1 Anti-sigma regulatory factor (Ser/Thr protein kinase) [Streptomyces sp. WMMB 322]
MTDETVPPPHAAQVPALVGHFTMRFSSTPRGARLARRLTGNRLETWGIPYGGTAHDELVLVVDELAANAVQHGRVSGRDFRLTLTALGSTVRVEVTDTRAESMPVTALPSEDREGGRGLLLVAALAARWGWRPRRDGPGKTVWAEYELAVFS